MGIKVFAIVLALVSLLRVFQRFRRTRRVTIELVIWLIAFSGIGAVVFVPGSTDQFAIWLGVSSGFNALTFISVTVLLLLMFRVMSRLQKVERDITLLVRAEAIELAMRVSPANCDGTDADRVKVDGVGGTLAGRAKLHSAGAVGSSAPNSG